MNIEKENVMKKNGFLLLIMGLIAVSCTNVKESKEYKDLQAQRDSLLMRSAGAESEAAEMMAVISEVEANFARIREAEKYIASQSAQGEEMTQDTKQRVQDNFMMINEILQRNKAQLEQLNRKQSAGSKEIASLKNTINRLNTEMRESTTRLAVLQEELARKDEQIAQLSEDVTALAQEAEQQSVTIREQDKTLHTAYYVFGTAAELKEQKILSGGFLQQTRVLQDTFNKEYFLKIDIREVTEIPLYAPKGKVWSTHPEGTYEFVKGDDGNLVLLITDTQRFWSLTKYLIVEVK
jgi:DNA repair exonuclease SbcCD ATPase subunit